MPTAATSQETLNSAPTAEREKHALARLHIAVGLATFAVFLLTGVYMRIHQVRLLPDGVRLLYRSRHIYLLMTGLLNLLVGVQYRPATGWKLISRFGSTLLLVAPVLICAGFFYDSTRGDLTAPLSRVGVIMVAVGAGLLALANRNTNQG